MTATGAYTDKSRQSANDNIADVGNIAYDDVNARPFLPVGPSLLGLFNRKG